MISHFTARTYRSTSIQGLATTLSLLRRLGSNRRSHSSRKKIDSFITGEAPHWATVAADELGMNLLLGGHYATEVFGVKALAAHLSRRFRISWAFIDCPT